MNQAAKLDVAVQDYLHVAKNYREDTREYSQVEIAKLAVANAFLETLGIDTYPVNEQFEPEGITNPLRNGFVYLMRNTRNGYVKIGWSIDPKFREKTLQSEEPEINLLWKWQGTRATEAALHARFAAKRVRGEWFGLSESDILLIQTIFTEGEVE